MEKNGIKGTVQVFGTPAEENLVAKAFMNRDGVLDGLDVLIDWHPDTFNYIGYYTDWAVSSYKFRFFGQATHAATANLGRSALVAVELMNTAANHIRLHFLKESDIRYVITKGGESPGVIPGYAEVWYNIRGRRRAHTDDLQKWILDVAKGAALMSQTRMEYQILASNYELLPSRPLAKTGLELMKLIGLPTLTEEDHKFGDPFVRSIGKEPFEGKFSYAGRLFPDPDFNKTFPNIFQTGGSNDVNTISWKIPFLRFGAATWPLWTQHHSWQAVAVNASPTAMKAGIQASKWMAASALECLTNPKLVQEAKEELQTVVAKNGGYKEPLPPDAKMPTFKDLFGVEPTAVPGMTK